MKTKKSKYTKEEIAAARAQRREAMRVLTATRRILFPRRLFRRIDSFDLISKLEKRLSRRIERLETKVKKLTAKKPKR